MDANNERKLLHENDQPGRQVISMPLLTIDDACSGSHVSCRTKSSSCSQKAKLLVYEAELNKKHLIQQLSLENQQQILKATNKIELARLRASVLDEECDIVKPEPKIPVDSADHLERYLQDCQGLGVSLTPTIPDTSSRVIMPNSIYKNVELPRVELECFYGSPKSYWKFRQQFKHYVEQRVNDSGQRLLYLIHYCKEEAKTAISECVMLSPEIGYKRAWSILEELYGENHMCAMAIIDDLLKDLKPMGSDSKELSRLSIKMQSCEIALTQMQYEADLNALTTLEQIVRVLPLESRKRWAVVADGSGQRGDQITFRNLCQFVASEARVGRSRFGKLAVEPPVNRDATRLPLRLSERRWQNNGNSNAIQGAPAPSSFEHTEQCLCCGYGHHVTNCVTFKALSLSRRWDCVKQQLACFVCLKRGHRSEGCSSTSSCSAEGCKGRHHRLLHDERWKPLTNQCGSTNVNAGGVRLGILPVRVEGPYGTVDTYALLDNGSDVTVIQEDVLEELGIDGTPSSLRISTVTGSSTLQSKTVRFTLRPLSGEEIVEVDKAYCVSQLPIKNAPTLMKNSFVSWPHLRDVPVEQIADVRVRLLIGADVPEAHWVLEQRVGTRKQPYAAKTLLGWTVLGPMGLEQTSNHTVNHVENELISEQIRRLYDAEFADVESIDPTYSVDDKRAIEIAESSVTYVEGHYEIALPWKKSSLELPNNYEAAHKRLNGLCRRFRKDIQFFNRYRVAIDNNIQKRFAVLVSPEQLTLDYRPRWYLPHHAVINQKKPDKLRVVFDCAARYGGTSLNESLHQGPDTTASLVGILLRFRNQAIAVVADIEEMFMQVKVPLSDQGALRFLWFRNHNINTTPIEYQMTVHPFGARSSPFCANYALKKTFEDWGGNCMKQVINSVSNNFYVDDCLISLPSVGMAIEFAKEIKTLLKAGGFKLKKWSSNEREVLSSLTAEEHHTSVVELGSSTQATERTLGLEWNTCEDTFQFRFQLKSTPCTRRGLLSSLSTLFDPLGLLAPLVLPAKLLLQQLCKRKLGWDESIQSEDLACWHSWLKSMQGLGDLRIPRCIRKYGDLEQNLQLHLFCDASELGYGVVAYVRFERCNTVTYCSLLCAKSRVAPLKTVTIPRLELTAATLAARLSAVLRKEAALHFKGIYFWTDSKIVLYYINNTSSRFSTFVANRLATIHQLTEMAQWRHVRSGCNPADLASRGTVNHRDLELWFKGPEYLTNDESSWPKQFERTETPDGVETKCHYAAVHATIERTGLERLLEYHSQWLKLLKSLAWLTRFKIYIKVMMGKSNEGNLKVGALKVSELRNAETDLIRMVQRDAYATELLHLRENKVVKTVSRKSSLWRLSPVVLNGILCVGGRLAYLNIHPIILPNRHTVVEKLIRYHHYTEGHSGASQVLSSIRKRYWIVQGAATVKRVVGSCWTCRKYLASSGRQMMAPLPKARIEQGWNPFKYVGVDYFGPLLVRRGRSNEKRYGCLFTCLQIRAIHIEVTNTLSADSFIMALMRFVARRGSPSDVFSDNGSNFVGAEAELRRAVRGLSSQNVETKLTELGIQWHFNPPASSHRGGVWERMIRSVRRVLYSVVGEQTLTDETLTTFLIEAERVINNRPIVSVNIDDSSIPALTPNDLLLLRTRDGRAVPPTMKERYTRCWHHANYLTNLFWKRWTKEYLPTLQCRQKWMRPQRNFKPGDVVIITSDSMPRGHWPLGVIHSCDVSNDSLVRTVSVRTKDGLMRRDIRKVCLIEGVD